MKQPIVKIESWNLGRLELYERHGFMPVRSDGQFHWLQRNLMWEEPWGLETD